MPIRPSRAERQNLWRLLEMARAEDLGSGDLTSSIFPADIQATGRFVARQELILCGAALLEAIAVRYDGQLRTTPMAPEGKRLKAGATLALWRGPARAMMAAERVALNFLQRLSAVATATRQYVNAVAGTGAEIYDTRKTTPAWRELEKYAVRVGGGKNHRRGLYDAVLIKDNHLAILAKADGLRAATEAIAQGLERLRPHLGDRAFVMLEVDTIRQLRGALSLPVDIILLDNMSADQLRRAVKLRNQTAPHIELEASGGITIANVRAVAQTGVERISVGAITHSAGAIDIALDIEID